jgi:hypothetical protein
MQWIILRDHLANDKGGPDWFVTASMPPGFTKETVAALPYEFELFDDDGERYYSGKCGDVANADESQAFAPLDWAMSEAGATYMMIRKVGQTQWEQL